MAKRGWQDVNGDGIFISSTRDVLRFVSGLRRGGEGCACPGAESWQIERCCLAV